MFSSACLRENTGTTAVPKEDIIRTVRSYEIIQRPQNKTNKCEQLSCECIFYPALIHDLAELIYKQTQYEFVRSEQCVIRRNHKQMHYDSYVRMTTDCEYVYSYQYGLL